MKRRIQILFVVLLGAFLATPALAQQPGGYIGAGFLSSSTDNADDFAKAAIGPTGKGDKSATGLKVYGGYMWGRWGIEGGLYDLGTREVKAGATKTDEFKTGALTISGVGTWPLGTAFNLNAKAGLAFTSVDYKCLQGCGGPVFVNTKESGSSLLLGFGGGWNVAKSFTLRLDYEFFSNVKHAAGTASNDASYNTLSLSGQYNF